MKTILPASPTYLPRRYRWARVIHLAGLLYLSLMGWSRMILALADRGLLMEIGVSPGPDYLAVGGAVWGLLGIAAAVLLYVPRRWARLAVFASGVLFALSYWLDRLILVRAPQAQANWPFALSFTLVLLVFSASLMVLLSQSEVLYGRQRRT
jgi:hypothetical protein